jgi:hypothetical protein
MLNNLGMAALFDSVGKRVAAGTNRGPAVSRASLNSTPRMPTRRRPLDLHDPDIFATA